MDEKKLFEQIRQSASDLTPPESLSPEAIEKMLTNPASGTSDQTNSKEADTPHTEPPAPEIHRKTSRKSRRKTYFPYYRVAGAAAAVVLCMTALLQVNKIQKESADLEKSSLLSGLSTQSETGQTDSAKNTADDLSAKPYPNSGGSLSDSSDKENTGDTSAHSDTGIVMTEAPALSPANSYEEIFEALHEQFYYDDSVFYAAAGARDIIGNEVKNSDALSGDIASDSVSMNPDEISYEESSLEDSAPAVTFSGSGLDKGAADETTDFSTTNIQEIGVDEADIVKTDGTYIYILRQNGAVTIVNADPASPEVVSTIAPADAGLTQIYELYLDEDVLSIIARRDNTLLEQENDTYYTSTINQTVLYTYDISDRAAPKLTGTVIQDGYYNTSRKNGDYIYLFTSYYPNIRATYEESNIIPCINQNHLDASDFYLPEHLNDSAYLLISSMDIRKPGKILDKKALVSGTSNFYVSTENIYIANENWSFDKAATTITRFHYADGIVTGMAAGSVKGYLNNSFSMNEYDGYLRVVSTYYGENWEERNALYVLDESLNITGSIENLAEGETIRSARFFGNTGYFVTFRQTDPLFSADLSDPADPVILGELKVSGFSSYLHFYGENLLLGMGYEADENTGIISGVKLSMFDISDPSAVKELHRIIIPGVTWCPSMNNYKSILIDPEKNLFGFFCGERYLVFSYNTEKGFISELVYDLIADTITEQSQTVNAAAPNADTPEENFISDEITADTEATMLTDNLLTDDVLTDEITVDSDSSMYAAISAYNTRGLYIGNTLYLAGDVSVIAFDMTDGFSKTGSLQLAE